MKRLLLIKIFCLIICANLNAQYLSSGGTSIIAILLKDSSYIVADSKRSTLNSDTRNYTYSTICKIHQVNNCFFAFAGANVSLQLDDKHVLYDAALMLANEFQKTKNFDSAFRIFNNKILQKLRMAAVHNFEYDSTTFKKNQNWVILHAIAFTYINKKLKFFSRQYYQYGLSRQEIKVAVDSSEDKLPLPTVLYIGFHDHIDNYNSAHPNKEFDLNKINKWGQDFIQLEIDSHPNEVGKPVNILKIYKDNKTAWIIKNQPCN